MKAKFDRLAQILKQKVDGIQIKETLYDSEINQFH